MTYVDGFILPLRDDKVDAYKPMAEKFARKAREQGALGSLEAVGDGLEHGHTTDFFRAVKAEDGENVVFSFIEWPDKATRDQAWGKIMEDESLRPQGDTPFDGKRMFWGGFDKIVDTAEQPAIQAGAPVTA